RRRAVGQRQFHQPRGLGEASGVRVRQRQEEVAGPDAWVAGLESRFADPQGSLEHRGGFFRATERTHVASQVRQTERDEVLFRLARVERFPYRQRLAVQRLGFLVAALRIPHEPKVVQRLAEVAVTGRQVLPAQREGLL